MIHFSPFLFNKNLQGIYTITLFNFSSTPLSNILNKPHHLSLHGNWYHQGHQWFPLLNQFSILIFDNPPTSSNASLICLPKTLHDPILSCSSSHLAWSSFSDSSAGSSSSPNVGGPQDFQFSNLIYFWWIYSISLLLKSVVQWTILNCSV